MTSEIRANTLKNRVGLGTVEYTNTGIVVSGIVTANSFSGPLTATSIDLNGDLDVDGHTNLDNVSIAGVTTFSDTTESNSPTTGSVRLLGGLGVVKNIQTSGGLYATGTAGLNITHSADINGDLDVDGHTNLDNVSIAGITTTTENIRIQGNNKYLTVGASNQIGVVHTGGEAFITNSTGHLTHRCGVHKWENQAGSAEYLRIDSNGNITQGVSGDATFAAINSISANAARGIEIFKDGTDTGSAIKLAGDNGSGNKAYSQLGYSGANASAHLANYNTSGTKVGEISITADGVIETGTAVGAAGADGNQRLRVGRIGDCNIAVRATGSTTASTGYDFGDQDDDRAGRIQYVHSGNYMSFHTNGAGSGASNERFRITSSGTAVFGGNTAAPIVDNGELYYRGNSTSTFENLPQNFYLYSDDKAYNATNPGAGLLFGGTYQSGGGYTTFAGIHGIKENNTDNNYNSALVFGTRQQSSSSWERLRITSSGDVTTTGTSTFSRQNAGFTARAGDSVSITRASGTPLEINRTGSDGQMISLMDDNVQEAAISISSGSLQFGTPNSSNPRLNIGSGGEVSLRRGGISATPSLEIYGSGNASDADADNLRFHNWGNSSGDYWQIGVNSTLDGNGNNAKPSTTLKGAAIRLNAKNGKVTLITSPSSTSTQYEGLSQNENGIVTIPQQPSFHARRTTNQSAMANPLVFDTAHHNNGSHYKTSGSDQGKFVAPVSGVYLFYWTAIKTTNGTVTRLYINVDGSHIYGSMHLRLQESGTYSNGSMQAIVNLNAGQKVHISLEVGAIHGSEYTHFGGYLIG